MEIEYLTFDGDEGKRKITMTAREFVTIWTLLGIVAQGNAHTAKYIDKRVKETLAAMNRMMGYAEGEQSPATTEPV